MNSTPSVMLSSAHSAFMPYRHCEVDEIAIFKVKFYEFCMKNDIHDVTKYSFIHNDMNEELIETFLNNYIYHSMTQAQINSVICKYGIANAMALFHDFHTIGMKCNSRDVCEYIEDPSMKTDYYMVELIFLDAVGFHNRWRLNTM